MTSKISTEHPEYTRFRQRRILMADALGDQDDIRAKGDLYLPRTGGMGADVDGGSGRYEAYKKRARFPEVTTQALTAITGLVFENDPIGASDDIITNTNQTNTQLAREAIRAVASQGRDIFVIDAPEASGEPFIARYSAESMINWRVDQNRPSDLLLAVFKEEQRKQESDIYGHETETVYRRYLRNGATIQVSRWIQRDGNDVLLEPEITLPVDTMPIIIPGSIDLTPQTDPIPLLPVARAAISYYQLSADYRMSLHINGNPTPWLAGCSEDQYQANIKLGIGAGVVWYLGGDSESGQAGFLETTGASHSDHKEAMADELKQAETYAVRLTQSNTAESGVAIRRRAESQHASIYTMADSVSIAITQAQRIRAKWKGESDPDDFVIDADVEEEYAGEQMINALNTAVNSGNAPQSSIFEAIRKAGLSEKTDDEMKEEIANQGALILEREPGQEPPLQNAS